MKSVTRTCDLWISQNGTNFLWKSVTLIICFSFLKGHKCYFSFVFLSYRNSFVLGQANSNLTYYDGLVKVKYDHGELYNSQPPTPRRTEITLICDRQAGRGHPVFVDEGVTTTGAYTFSWNTEYACPSSPIECTATGGGRQYDLSR